MGRCNAAQVWVMKCLDFVLSARRTRGIKSKSLARLNTQSFQSVYRFWSLVTDRSVFFARNATEVVWRQSVLEDVPSGKLPPTRPQECIWT